jgi:hypothetical protein
MTKAADLIGLHREQEQIDRSITRVIKGGDTLDQEARDSAHRALGKLDTHETLCTERWNQQRVSIVEMQKSLDAMNKRMVGNIPASIIAILMGAVGFLAARAFPLH